MMNENFVLEDGKEFFNSLPYETKTMFKQSITIYSKLSNEKLQKKNNLSDKELVIYSILLSILMTDDVINQIFTKSGFSQEGFLTHLNMHKNNITGYGGPQQTIIFIRNIYPCVFDWNTDLFTGNDLVISSKLTCTDIIFEIFLQNEDILNNLYSKLGLLPSSISVYNHGSFIAISALVGSNLKRLMAMKQPKDHFKDSTNNECNDPTTKTKNTCSDETKEPNKPFKYGKIIDGNKFVSNPAVGRDKEIRDVEVALVNGNACLVGEAGVGKTAIVEGLAYQISKGICPKYFQNKQILSVSVTSLLSGCMYRGMYEKRVEDLVNYLKDSNDIILFIDEIHMMMGSSSETVSLANMLKPYLDRGQIKMIGATTNHEYEEYIKGDMALARRFSKIVVTEPPEEMTIDILKETVPKLEDSTGVKFDWNMDTIFENIVRITDRKHQSYGEVMRNPALAISLLKNAFAYAVVSNNETLNISDIVMAISNENRINRMARSRMSKEILTKYNEENKHKTRCKVIPFRVSSP